MDTDDSPRGRLLTRREMLTLLGAGGAAQTAGPYFVDERLHRSDIRSDPGDGSGRQLLLDPTVVKGGNQASFEIGLDLD